MEVEGLGPKCSSPSPLLHRRKSTLTSSGEGITSILLDVPNALRTSSQKWGMQVPGLEVFFDLVEGDVSLFTKRGESKTLGGSPRQTRTSEFNR